MVYQTPTGNLEVLTCYLLVDISQEQLQAFKAAFELGNFARFSPSLRIKIVRPPEEYIGKSHEYIRRKEDEAGREEVFLILDDRAMENDAVWYIKWFADDAPMDDCAESSDVLWKILIRTDKLAMVYVNYDIGNMSLQEDLGNCGVEFPVKEGYQQPKVLDYDMDMHKAEYRQPTWVNAEPHEFEYNKGGEKFGDYVAPPRTLARLKDEVAEAAGVLNDWVTPHPAWPLRMSNGKMKEFPEGTMVLQLKINPDFPWPPFKWPEGSL
ncbi:hypothetical protein ACHAPV_002732 [Trichoderma viride]